MKFRDIFLEETTVDPFEKSLTIASACNLVYRKLFLKPETIAIIPHNGYRSKDKQSSMAIKWLQWIEHTQSIEIQHAYKGREERIGPFKVDGLCGQTIYEFYGCFWHGCPKCMKQRFKISADQYTTAREAYDRTLERKKFLQDKGYTVVEKWQCDLMKDLKKNDKIRAFFENSKIVDPLNPREGKFR